eukprot:CAMPEP_0198134956 /NCGR_PEP_ID=MMETSP1442-20131203/60345_1 /TAXON_ID= /ORGANISM="Craspedostauros australis, Strain CCMP3328" /LENGTH=180 /DNA_ID=CAMNT_0043796117 /DNA_START=275 /DNA_END=817 /DNA_ORIENTATION=-
MVTSRTRPAPQFSPMALRGIDIHPPRPNARHHSQSPFSSTNDTPAPKRAKKRKPFIPRKAAVTLTEGSRKFFQKILESMPEKAGVMLKYQQATNGEPRMVFSFGFVSQDQLHPQDEGVSLEVLGDGTPKPPAESMNDGLPKLYIHHDAFLKVLGKTVDVNMETMSPVLKDEQGNIVDPNF